MEKRPPFDLVVYERTGEETKKGNSRAETDLRGGKNLLGRELSMAGFHGRGNKKSKRVGKGETKLIVEA